MPIKDPLKKKVAAKALLQKKICMQCYAKNPPSAKKCRRCQSTELRPKKKKLRAKGV